MNPTFIIFSTRHLNCLYSSLIHQKDASNGSFDLWRSVLHSNMNFKFSLLTFTTTDFNTVMNTIRTLYWLIINIHNGLLESETLLTLYLLKTWYLLPFFTPCQPKSYGSFFCCISKQFINKAMSYYIFINGHILWHVSMLNNSICIETSCASWWSNDKQAHYTLCPYQETSSMAQKTKLNSSSHLGNLRPLYFVSEIEADRSKGLPIITKKETRRRIVLRWKSWAAWRRAPELDNSSSIH